MLLAVLVILSLLLLPVAAADFAVLIINDDLDVDLRREDVFCLLEDSPGGDENDLEATVDDLLLFPKLDSCFLCLFTILPVEEVDLLPSVV